MQQLDRGEMPQIAELKKVVRLASDALSTGHDKETVQR